jgi:hypothetical protein
MPANTSAATAIDITSLLPYTEVVDPGGSGVALWYKYTTPGSELAIGIYTVLTTPATWSPGHYAPAVDVFTGTPASLAAWLGPTVNAMQCPIYPPQDFFIKIVNVASYTAGDTITISILKPNYNAYAAYDTFINDDTNGFPAMIFNALGQVSFVDTVAGERGALLPGVGGIMALQDRSAAGYNPGGTGVTGDNVRLYTNAFATIADVAGVIANNDQIEPVIFDNRVDTFYVIQNRAGAAPILRTISTAGVVGGTTYVLPGTSATRVVQAGLSRDGTILYYLLSSTNPVVKRYSLSTLSAMTDLAAGVGANWEARKDMLVLPDDSIVVSYFNESVNPQTSKIIHYESDGTIRYTNNFSFDVDHVNRLAYDPYDASDTYYAWLYFPVDDPADFNEVQTREVKFSATDGSRLASFDIQNYEVGVSTDLEFWDGVRFGPSTSCPFFILAATSSALVAADNTIECVHGSYRRTIPLSGSYNRTMTRVNGSYRRSINLTGSA